MGLIITEMEEALKEEFPHAESAGYLHGESSTAWRFEAWKASTTGPSEEEQGRGEVDQVYNGWKLIIPIAQIKKARQMLGQLVRTHTENGLVLVVVGRRVVYVYWTR